MAAHGNENKGFTLEWVVNSKHNHLFIQIVDAIKVYDIVKVGKKDVNYESYVTLHKSINSFP